MTVDAFRGLVPSGRSVRSFGIMAEVILDEGLDRQDRAWHGFSTVDPTRLPRDALHWIKRSFYKFSQCFVFYRNTNLVLVTFRQVGTVSAMEF